MCGACGVTVSTEPTSNRACINDILLQAWPFPCFQCGVVACPNAQQCCCYLILRTLCRPGTTHNGGTHLYTHLSSSNLQVLPMHLLSEPHAIVLPSSSLSKHSTWAPPQLSPIPTAAASNTSNTRRVQSEWLDAGQQYKKWGGRYPHTHFAYTPRLLGNQTNQCKHHQRPPIVTHLQAPLHESH